MKRHKLERWLPSSIAKRLFKRVPPVVCLLIVLSVPLTVQVLEWAEPSGKATAPTELTGDQWVALAVLAAGVLVGLTQLALGWVVWRGLRR